MLGTKGETLLNLKKVLNKSKVCPIIIFTVEDWEKDKSSCINTIQSNFHSKHIIVRSSALDEDNPMSAMAGYYHSVLDVFSNETKTVQNAVEEVIESYKKNRELNWLKCQILIQPVLKNVSMTGVVFIRDLDTGAPYYVINYDDESGCVGSARIGIFLVLR